MKKICRICLKVCSQPAISIDSTTLNLSYYEIYRYVSGFGPTDDPKYLCLGCARKLCSVYKFKKKIEENEIGFSSKNVRERDNEEEDCVKLVTNSINESASKDVEYESKLVEKVTKIPYNNVSSNSRKGHRKLKQKHVSESQTICGYCGRLFNQKTIKSHIKNVHLKSVTEFMCDLCNSKFTTKAGLLSHMKGKHLFITFSCRYCSECFPNRSVRRTHELRFHTFDLRFTCTFCTKKFPDNAQLKRHTSTHTGERKHICLICGMAFITKNKLKLHSASHSSARPYPCSSCTAAFKTLNNLRQHEQTHGNRNYDCPVCHFAYLTNQQMRNHVKKVHPDYDLPPPGTVMNKGALNKISAITEKYQVNVSANVCITRNIK